MYSRAPLRNIVTVAWARVAWTVLPPALHRIDLLVVTLSGHIHLLAGHHARRTHRPHVPARALSGPANTGRGSLHVADQRKQHDRNTDPESRDRGIPSFPRCRSARVRPRHQVSILHDFVHLLFGIVGLALARSASGARSYLIGGGAVYVALWIYGLVIDQTSSANVVPLNTADNWLHLVLGIGMIGLGIALSRSVPHTSTPRA
jgi:hypothetical protein